MKQSDGTIKRKTDNTVAQRQARYRERQKKQLTLGDNIPKDNWFNPSGVITNLSNKIVDRTTSGIATTLYNEAKTILQNEPIPLADGNEYKPKLWQGAIMGIIGAGVGYFVGNGIGRAVTHDIDDEQLRNKGKLYGRIGGTALGTVVGIGAWKNLYVPYQMKKHNDNEQLSDGNYMMDNTADTLNHKLPKIRLDGIWSEFLGEYIDKGASFIASGVPGSGKSTLMYWLISHVQHLGKVHLYLTEQDLGHSQLQLLFKYLNIQVDAKYTDDPNFIMKSIEQNKPDFVFIDSVNNIQNGEQLFEYLRKRKEQWLLWGTFQSTKSGDVRGSQTSKHNADTVITVEDGIATTTNKCRYGRSGNKLDLNPLLSKLHDFSTNGERHHTLDIIQIKKVQ